MLWDHNRWERLVECRMLGTDTRSGAHPPHEIAIGGASCCWPHPDLDTAGLDKVMTYIEEHPEQHEQAFWATVNGRGWEILRGLAKARQHPRTLSDIREQIDALPICGTSHCFAGNALMLLGPEQVQWLWDSDGLAYMFVDPDGGTGVWVGDWARERLGLTHSESRGLFYSGNTRDQLRRAIGALTEAESIRLARRDGR